MQTKDELKEIIANDYLKRFFTFFVGRTHSITEAEDLSQKTACDCLDSIDRVEFIYNVNAYFWSIAHNVYKNYLKSNDNYYLDNDYCMVHIEDIDTTEEMLIRENLHNDIRKSLSILSDVYRKVLVYFYYHNLKIKEISIKLNATEDMIKYYLSNGKKKLKEIYNMNKDIGEQSFNPREFSIYYSGIDFTSTNVGQLFRRQLPGQIALICYKKPTTISEIAMEVGCASCYVEEELNILLDAGVIKQITKNKYQTNFYIISKDELEVVDDMYRKMYKEYTIKVSKAFDDNLENIKETNIYNYDTSIDQYKWIFTCNIANLDYRNLFIKDSDYPIILSCGSRGFVYGLESDTPKGTCGQTPTYLDKYTLWAKDLWIMKGESTNQPILRDKKIAQTVIDVYNGIIDDSKDETYAYLIKYGILIKKNGLLKCCLANLNSDFMSLIEKVNNELYQNLEKSTIEIKTYLTKIVSKTIPDNLKQYVNGYVIILMQFFAGNKIIEELNENKFLNDKIDNIQISYFKKTFTLN